MPRDFTKPMEWMKRGERPTVPGWYWIEHGGVVKVEGVFAPRGRLGFGAPHLVDEFSAYDMDGFRFAGPIPLPEAPDAS